MDWWQPEGGQTWQVQYTGDIDLEVDADIFNLDLFETTPEMIEYLHENGKKVICYLNAGALEDWRSDSSNFPDEIIGKQYQGWPDERWLDIRRMDLLTSLIGARLDLCAEKGFDGVDPDNIDGYTNNTGFPITYHDQLEYNRWLSDEAHSRDLAIGLKNDPDQIKELVTYFDWITTESCFEEGWCDQVEPFFQAFKPVFAIEYFDDSLRISDICDQPFAKTIKPVFKHLNLDAWRQTCP